MVDVRERFVPSGPLRIWTERVGDPGLPAVLMVMGSAAQAVSCPDALVGRLVERDVQVIRFDHRDTGRSSVVDFDAHPYTISDLARDCLAVLDGYGLGSAHVAGTSLGGMIAQWLGVHAPGRVRSLTVMSSSLMGHDPGPVWARAIDPAAAANHFRAVWMDDPGLKAPLSSITAPTSIVHGDQDPVYPLGHGEALAAAIPGAVLQVVPGMGHVMTSPGLPEEIADLIRL